ncbi:ECF-type sigma factor [Anatilimnocola floriformis]|uniref:ECF-type sigma factor n=1 Tax=Anatilimnocola floriformis TaxID=2948575 RepID=UPI0020C43455|nr:ECF-type sigma factor [Anatilimnocola floriformis]
MSDPGSVTHWIVALKDGDLAAAAPLWQRYYRQLITLARQKLRSSSSRAADEEDVVQVAFQSFFRAIAEGRFPELNDRDGLWRLLVVITARKAIKQLHHEQRQKRGGPGTNGAAKNGKEKNGTSQGTFGIDTIGTDDEAALATFIDPEPTPDFAVQIVEECRRLLVELGDEKLRRVAVWKMEGYGNDEIAALLACSRRTVARKLDAIRTIWNKEPPP